MFSYAFCFCFIINFLNMINLINFMSSNASILPFFIWFAIKNTIDGGIMFLRVQQSYL